MAVALVYTCERLLYAFRSGFWTENKEICRNFLLKCISGNLRGLVSPLSVCPPGYTYGSCDVGPLNFLGPSMSAPVLYSANIPWTLISIYRGYPAYVGENIMLLTPGYTAGAWQEVAPHERIFYSYLYSYANKITEWHSTNYLWQSYWIFRVTTQTVLYIHL